MGKGRLKKAVQKAKEKIVAKKDKVVGKIKKTVKKVAEKTVEHVKDTPYIQLLPLKPLMVRALDKKGISHTSHLHDIVPKFYNNIVRKDSHFDDPALAFFEDGNGSIYFEGSEMNLDVSEISEMIPGKYTGEGAQGAAAGAAVPQIGMIQNLIKAVIKYFKDLKKKKDEGGVMSEDEKEILEGAEDVAEAVVDSAKKEVDKDDAAGAVKDFLFSWKGGLLLAIVAILLLIYFNKK